MTAPLRRVVYVISLFPCWSETFIVREIDALIAAGVDVRILSLKPVSETLVQRDAAALMGRVRHPLPGSAALAALARTALRHPRVLARIFADVIADGWRQPQVMLKSLTALLRGMAHVDWLREFDPDFIHAHWATYPSTVAWALGRVLDKPFGFTCHAHDIFVERQLLARKLSEAALPVTISRYNAGWLHDHVAPDAAQRLQVVHCGVDIDDSLAPASEPAPDTILAVGRLVETKGFDTLIDALALLRDRGVEFRCRIVGGGPLDAALRGQAHERGIADRVEFAGVQPQEAVRAWMRESTVFALPSRVAADGDRDGIPVALMEAMTSDCAVASTRVSGIPELVEHDVHGLLVEPDDATALADALQRLLRDAMLRRRLTACARARIEQAFDVRKEATRLRGLMQNAVHRFSLLPTEELKPLYQRERGWGEGQTERGNSSLRRSVRPSSGASRHLASRPGLRASAKAFTDARASGSQAHPFTPLGEGESDLPLGEGNSKLRVLYVVSLFPCWSETFIVREMHALLGHGADIGILSLKPSSEAMVQERAAELLDRVRHPRAALHSIAGMATLTLRHPLIVGGFVATLCAHMWRQPGNLLRSLGALCRAAGQWRWIRDFDPQIIHAPWATYPATVAWFLSRLTGKPYSFTSRAHDIFVEDHMMAAKLASTALAVTITRNNVRHMARWMKAPGAVPIEVVHSALDLPEIAYRRDARAQHRLLSVGRLDPIKGFDVLLPALAELAHRGVAFDSVIIGEGEEHARLEAQRDALGLRDRVSFAGAQSNTAVRAAMAEATLMVMPCVVTPEGNADGIPNVLTEAMASGLPVVSTRVSGIPELIDDGVSGRLVEPNDALALADAVAEMLSDPVLRDACAEAGRRKVECEFDVRSEAGRLFRHMAQVAHG
jgi:glycosyltransferase involved in cell wall biosynthesis